ncbi:transposase [Kitasatospora sp. NPDC004669]|uniref:transposase n=1 Tax=Kitasatospora sp. NPDC004669 TaxID=3154555 RepID=UPI0033A9E532
MRCNKDVGLHNLPSQDWTVNRAWMLTCNLAADLDAWSRLLGLHDHADLADAEPATMRYRLYHLPAKLTRHVRHRWLTLSRTWPWPWRVRHLLEAAQPTARTELTRRQQPDENRRRSPHNPGAVEPGRSRSDTRRSPPRSRGTNGANHRAHQRLTAPTNRGQLKDRGQPRECLPRG